MERDPRFDAKLRQRVAKLYRAGHSTREVARRVGRSRNRVVQLLNESGVPLRPRGRPAKASHEPPRAA